MLVVIANDLPPAVRGRMKLWFIEVKPNVFVSGITGSLADTVINFLYKYCPPESGVMLLKSISKSPGYLIQRIGPTIKQEINISGLQLIVESMQTGT